MSLRDPIALFSNTSLQQEYLQRPPRHRIMIAIHLIIAATRSNQSSNTYSNLRNIRTVDFRKRGVTLPEERCGSRVEEREGWEGDGVGGIKVPSASGVLASLDFCTRR